MTLLWLSIFARGPKGINPDPYVTEFKIQDHLANHNFENSRSWFDINPNIGRSENEFLIDTEIPKGSIVRQWRVQ